ncbi:MAG TPA: hypothetical protein VFR05_02285 [Terriglobia bacterium]|nr:hypothetical protein [Terriglobia bacterium]
MGRGVDYLPKLSQTVEAIPPHGRKPCEKLFKNHQPCYFTIVYIGKDSAEWRCIKCLRYIGVDFPRQTGQGQLF